MAALCARPDCPSALNTGMETRITRARTKLVLLGIRRLTTTANAYTAMAACPNMELAAAPKASAAMSGYWARFHNHLCDRLVRGRGWTGDA